MDEFKPLLLKVASGHNLTRSESASAFEMMMSGQATLAQMGAFLMGLRVRGETVDEITGAADIMRAKALRVEAPPNAIDTCGTGGDGSGTLNISTAAAFVVAACGVPVAKHGNKALSSKSGSADVLQQLGVRLDLPPERISICIKEAGLGFMMAPLHHAAMKHVAPVRTELGTRTIFNLLGPLSNPAQAKRQLIGVYAERWLEPMAQVLQKLGSERVWVVHGEDGLDEITVTTSTQVASLDKGKISRFEITPEQGGLGRARPQELEGGDPEYNAGKLRQLLDGKPGAYRDIVILNSAAALIVADKVHKLIDGVKLAGEAIDNGNAQQVLDKLIEVSNA